MASSLGLELYLQGGSPVGQPEDRRAEIFKEIELILERKEVLLADRAVSEEKREQDAAALDDALGLYEEELAELSGDQA